MYPLSAADTRASSAVYWMDLLGLLSIPALVALNAFFVAAEFALVAVRKTRIEELIAQKVSGAHVVMATITNLDRAIAATQLGITLASLALGWSGERALEHLLSSAFEWVPANMRWIVSHSVAGTLAFMLITFMHVVFGELIPKTVALQTPDQVALWIARPLNLFTWITRPLIYVMNGSGNAILRACGYRPDTTEGMVHSVEELSLLIEDTEEAGILDSDQAGLVRNVFLLSKKTVRDCMVPREEMMALEINTSSDHILEAVRSGGHTRIPIYEGTIDNMIGLVNTKNLFHLFSLHGLVILQDAMYPPLYLKPDESIANALRLFRKARKPMALVRDEDGKIHGLVTLEDVLEEIIGDIEDEHDDTSPFKVMLWRDRELPRPPTKPKPLTQKKRALKAQIDPNAAPSNPSQSEAISSATQAALPTPQPEIPSIDSERPRKRRAKRKRSQK
ncbi:MAG: hemolysin family protein [Gemmataceae bacterium]